MRVIRNAVRSLVVVISLSGISGCMGRAGSIIQGTPKHLITGIQVVESAAAVCDLIQTEVMADSWGDRFEKNRILGTRPSNSAIGGYFLISYLVVSGLTKVMPTKPGVFMNVLIATKELITVMDNRIKIPGICGLR